METFMDLVMMYCKNLQSQQWCEQVLTTEELQRKQEIDPISFKNNKHSECLTITEHNFKSLLNLLTESWKIQDEKTKNQCQRYLKRFILPFIVYGKIQTESGALTHEEILKTYLLDGQDFIVKSTIASAIMANYTFATKEAQNFISETVQIGEIITVIEEAETDKEIDEERLVSILDFWINCLHNEEFRSTFSEGEVGLKLYEAITKINSVHPHKLSLTIKRLVIKLIIKLTLGFEKNENLLAKRIIKDLEPLKEKKDIDYVNNILTPLLKAEKKVPISLDFFDNKSQGYYTFSHAIEKCMDSPKVDNFLSNPYFSSVIPALESVVSENYNSQKLLISDWKPIVLLNKEGSSALNNFVPSIKNRTSLFYLFEGTSKKLGDQCFFGIYNRNSLYKKNDSYVIDTSKDHFCFATLGKSEHYCFRMKPRKSLLEITSGKNGEINFASGFVTLKNRNSTSIYGAVVKDAHDEIKASSNYSQIQDFKLEKFRIFELSGMNESSSDSGSQSSKSNPISPIYNSLVEKYQHTESLNFFRENCFFVAENQTLEELSYDLFGFNTRITSSYAPQTLSEIHEAHKKSESKDNIIDLTLSFEEVVDKSTTKMNQTKPTKPSLSKKYIPKMGIFTMFEKENGVTELITITQKSVNETWKNKELATKWGLWLLELQSFTKLPLFFQFFMKDKQFKDLLFEILAGVPDQQAGNSQHWSERQVEAVKQTYKIIKEMFQASKDKTIRDKAAENGLIEKILIRLKEVTGEINRTYEEEKSYDELSLKSQTSTFSVASEESSKTEDGDKKKVKNYEKKKRKGVGYTTGVGKTWNVSQYIKNKKVKNEQISYLIEILSNFFRTKDWEPENEIVDDILVSCLLPLIENAFRTGSLLDMVKYNKLYISYLRLVRVFAKSKVLCKLLIDIGPEYKPKQIEPIHKLLSKLNDLANIYNNCLNTKESKESEKDSEVLIKEIKKTFKVVNKVVERLAFDNEDDFYENALHLPLRESYPLLMKNLRFDHMDMRNKKGSYSHHYIKNYSKNVSSSKVNRLAQELADLSTALPTDHTNAIFVRVDKDRVDLMKALVMGAEGTPYAHGAFEFDIYCNQNYPKDPPKMNLTTTGSSAVRFNPNLYACGKVCLSLLGTWRGNATENWDPKISTILQVLMSTQAIIMSEEIYFNEPGFEGEAGTPDGERKNEGYSNIIKYCNIKFAMLEQIKNPPKGFKTIIRRHFYLKKEEILADCKKWIEEAKEHEALYTGLVSDHNYNWCNKFKVKGTYEKMLTEIVAELEEELNKLPEPSGQDLAPQTKIVKRRSHKVTRDIHEGAVRLDNIDVDSDEETIVTTNEINVNQEDVKDRWSRYIGAMGIEAVAKQATSRIFLSGASPAGIEVAKNVVLAGCKSFTLHDTKNATYLDLAGQFFIHDKDIGQNRATASIKRLQQLNDYVKCNAETFELPSTEEEMLKVGFEKYNIICLSQCSYKTAIAINEFCRKRKIKFIYFDVFGPFARIFNDFGEEFVVLDKDGEDLKERWIKSISTAEQGLVEVLDTERHELDDGDKVAITEVIGMNLKEGKDSGFKSSNINETIHKVEVVNPFSFKIGDTTIFSDYKRNGKITQVKVPVKFKFDSLKECLENPEIPLDQNMSIADFEKMGHISVSHACFEALDIFIEKHNRMPNPWDQKDHEEFFKLIDPIAERLEQEIDETWKKIISLFCFTCQGTLNPLCAFIGGFLAQELVKAMTQKYSPIKQLFYFNNVEVCPEFKIEENFEETVKKIDVLPHKNRYDGLRIVLGGDLLKQIQYSNIFMVGAGAIGCELLKNYAMLGIGTGKQDSAGKSGRIVLTDPDHIENSNLNRQFLFRKKHIQKSKSSTAAAAAINMNPELKGNILARLDKVHEASEHIFTDNFFENQTAVTNALDNVAARRYIDGRCVMARTPLIEGGTLGPKGNVQVIIPFKTESYSSQTDPEDNNQIPHCTLKMFPEESIHCIEWGKDIFTNLFTQIPQEVNKIIEDKTFQPQTSQEISSLKQVLESLKSAPKTFDDCLRIAREKFNEYFSYNIKQLLYVYPLDTKTKDGKPFWTMPKRPPHDVEFNPKTEMHFNFISSCACLFATIHKIKIPFKLPRSPEAKLEMAAKAEEYKVKEFVPDESEAKEIKSMVEKEESKEDEKEEEKEEEETKTEETDVNELMKELKVHLNTILPGLKAGDSHMQVEEFEKDQDTNYHIDFIFSISNLRCDNYELKQTSWLDVKLKAGKIIPALATTTAAVAGMQTLELLKLMKCEKLEQFRNYYLNLALPFVQGSEPGEVKKTKLVGDLEVDLWSRWDISNKDMTLKELFTYVQEKHNLCVRDVVFGNQTLYLQSIMDISGKESQKEETLNSKIIDLTE